MRILFVVPYVPSPIRVRSYNLIRSLMSLGHRVDVVTVTSGKSDKADAEALRRAGIEVLAQDLSRGRSMLNCLAALPSRVPLQAVYSWSPGLARRIWAALYGTGQVRYDVAHVEHLRGSRYGLYLRSRCVACEIRLPVIWDSVDCISLLFRQASEQSRRPLSRLLAKVELHRTERYEAHLLRQFGHVMTTSPVDRKSLLALLRAGDRHAPVVSVIPNGVDLNYFRPDPARRREVATLVVSGKMSYHANVAMVSRLIEDIMPLIWARRPDVKLVVAGKDPPSEIRAFSNDYRVTITGTLKDIRPHLQAATVAVAPVVYGVGMQNKVLEAMACETPVVTTSKAISALEAVAGEDLLVADRPADFAEAVLGLLDDGSRREALGRAGRHLVEAQYPWIKIAGRLADVYASACGETGRG